MLKKNDLAAVTITDQSDTGEGIGKADGFPLFVRHAVIGDEAEVQVTRVKKNYGYARISRLIRPSENRVEPACPSWKRCGGCQLLNLSYPAQLSFKTNKVKQVLERIGGFSDIEVEECAASPEIFRYRNKVQYPIGTDREGELIAGFYAGRSHEIVPSADCMTGPAEFPKILHAVLEWMKENGITAYDETNGKGCVRHLYLRKGYATGEIGICLIINENRLKHTEELKIKLQPFKQITGITYSVNRSRSNVIMGEDAVLVFGRRCIRDRIGKIEYKIDPLSFYQVNPLQTRRLYDAVCGFAALTGTENVWDLYCGIGSISLYAADRARHVIGIEVIERAIADAKENAVLNGIHNAEFYAGDVTDVFPKLYRARSTPNDVIILDPPRKGCDPAVIEAILSASPKKIVYVSCNPATLARDLKLFSAGGYGIGRVRPYDMFPMSGHVETVCLLSNTQGKKKESYITLDVEMAD